MEKHAVAVPSELISFRAKIRGIRSSCYPKIPEFPFGRNKVVLAQKLPSKPFFNHSVHIMDHHICHISTLSYHPSRVYHRHSTWSTWRIPTRSIHNNHIPLSFIYLFW